MRFIIFTLFLFLPFFAGAQLNNGLIAWWPFSGNANDSTGKGHTGTLNNITFAAGKTGQPGTAASFIGDPTSYITAPYQSDLNVTAFSICAVLKPTGFYTAYCQSSRILQRGPLPASSGYFLELCDNAFDSSCVLSDSTKYVFQFAGGNNPSPYHSNWQMTPAVQKNQWITVVATFNGTVYKTFVNGVLKNSFTVSNPSTMTSGTDSLCIGRNLWNNTNEQWWFKGLIDDLRLYNRVLSDSEVVTYQTLNIEAPKEDIALNVFPNPNTGNFTVQGTLSTRNEVSISVRNMVGQTVYATTQPSGSNFEKNIELPGYVPNGLYLVSIRSGDQQKLIRVSLKR